MTGIGRLPPLLVLVFLLSVPAPAPAEEGPAADLDTVVRTAREGLVTLGLEEAELHPRHDFVSADAYRLDLVSTWLASPLAVGRDAHDRLSPWLADGEPLARSLRRAFRVLGEEAPAAPDRPRAGRDLAASLHTLSAGLDGKPDRARLRRDVAAVPRSCHPGLCEVLVAVGDAVRLRDEAFAKLTEEEWVQLRKFGSQFNTGMPPPMQVETLRRYHDRIDRTPLRKAALELAVVMDALGELREAASRVRSRPEFHVSIETPAGLVEIGGWGRNTYEKDALLTVDLGGDDTYANSAGGTLYTPRKISVCVDLAGDDEYATTVGLAQGSGMYGVGMLVDCAGDDVYESKNVSQGAGHVGVGVLWDWSGKDRYQANSVSQGAGFQGVGLLRDDRGKDRYRVGHTGQGFGTLGGLGILRDAAGDDRYAAGGVRRDTGRDPEHFLSMSQGFGLGNRTEDLAHCTSGGVGLLADREGDDEYVSDVFGQGCGYWYAAGVLLDGSGDDAYTIFNYGQGAGFHMAVGVLLDLAGDDRYSGRHHALGHALDRAVGWFVDLGGADEYESESDSQGAAVKPYAVAFFADLRGDDRYRGGSPGYVRVPEEGREGPWPKAFFMDLGGKDEYSSRVVPDAGEGKSWTFEGHGRGTDR